MELRHLRYFVAVAEEGSFTAAAERRLHTAQPSLSRQIRDLEAEVGVPLILRGPQGMKLTAAGDVFLEHARAILERVGTAREAARHTARALKKTFAVGFLSGYELALLPEVLAILQDELHDTEIVLNSSSSPELTQALLQGRLDLAFLRPYDPPEELDFLLVAKEPLMVVLPKSHPMASQAAIRVEDLAGEKLISISQTVSPALRQAIDDYLAQSDVSFAQGLEADHLQMAFTLVISTPGICFMAGYARRLLPSSVVGVPLHGHTPLVDLALGYKPSNTSSVLQLFLSKANELIQKHLLETQ